MKSDLFNILIPAIITSASIGTIISTVLQYYFKKNNTISDIDLARFNLYKNIYFSGVKNSFDKKIDKEIAHPFFKELYFFIKNNDELSLLLTKEAKGLLHDLMHENIKSNKDNILLKLQDRIQIDFKRLSNKLGYENISYIEKIKYFFAYITIYIDSCVLFVLINIVWIYIVENLNKLDFNFLAILFSLLFFAVLLLVLLISYCKYYSYINKYD